MLFPKNGTWPSPTSSAPWVFPFLLADLSLTWSPGDQEGLTEWSAFNQGSVPDTSPGEVWTYIGNFCSVVWQGFELLARPNHPFS